MRPGRIPYRSSVFVLALPLVLSSCTFGLDTLPGIEPALSAPIMTYEEYGKLEHAQPYVLRIDAGGGSLLYFGSRHTTDPDNPQIDSIVRLWREFQPTVALAEARKARRGSMAGGVKWFGESAVPVSLARDAGIPVYTFEPPLDLEMATLLRSWSRERLLMFYVLRSYTARAVQGRSDGQARELIRERGQWPGLDRAIRDVAHLDSIWQVEFPAGPAWRELPWQATWPTGTETWINRVSADVNRFRDQYMVALITTLLERGERVFAVVGFSHVVMQEPALREALASSDPAAHSLEVPGSGRRERRTSGPDAIVYSLTARGRRMFLSWMEESPAPERLRSELMLKVFFGARVSPEQTARQIREHQREQERIRGQYAALEQMLEEGDETVPDAAFWLLSLRRGQLLTDARLRWCRESLDTLASMSGRRPHR